MLLQILRLHLILRNKCFLSVNLFTVNSNHNQVLGISLTLMLICFKNAHRQQSPWKIAFITLAGVFELSIYLVCLPAALSSELGHVGLRPANLFAQLHLSCIISWLTPDTSVSLTGRLPTVALPNGPRPPILQVSIVEPVQTQTLSN